MPSYYRLGHFCNLEGGRWRSRENLLFQLRAWCCEVLDNLSSQTLMGDECI